jgi:hypothetical protein
MKYTWLQVPPPVQAWPTSAAEHVTSESNCQHADAASARAAGFTPNAPARKAPKKKKRRGCMLEVHEHGLRQRETEHPPSNRTPITPPSRAGGKERSRRVGPCCPWVSTGEVPLGLS